MRGAESLSASRLPVSYPRVPIWIISVGRQSVRNLGHHFQKPVFWRASGSATRRANEAIILGRSLPRPFATKDSDLRLAWASTRSRAHQCASASFAGEASVSARTSESTVLRDETKALSPGCGFRSRANHTSKKLARKAVQRGAEHSQCHQRFRAISILGVDTMNGFAEHGPVLSPYRTSEPFGIRHAGTILQSLIPTSRVK